jgi:hypothetical protein
MLVLKHQCQNQLHQLLEKRNFRNSYRQRRHGLIYLNKNSTPWRRKLKKKKKCCRRPKKRCLGPSKRWRSSRRDRKRMIWSLSASWTSTQVIDLFSSFVPVLARFLLQCPGCGLWTLLVVVVACELVYFCLRTCLWTSGSNEVNQWCVWTCGSHVFGNFGCIWTKSLWCMNQFVVNVSLCLMYELCSGMFDEAGHEWYNQWRKCVEIDQFFMTKNVIK